jgi:hypothetical protein
MTKQTARGTFAVRLAPGEPLVDRTGRFDLTKTWSGDLSGVGHGAMLSAGDPESGAAAYVAVETVEGTLGERAGGFAFVQLGTMARGGTEQTYVVAPGSGHGELVGLTGVLALEVVDGEHRYALTYELPD